MTTIADWIEKLRTKEDIRFDTDIGKLLNITGDMVGKILKGKKKVNTEKCLIMAKELDVRPEIILIQMLYEKEKGEKNKAELLKIIQRLKKSN
jgi:plasmid maintenance system antidote protein VapI